MGRIGHGYGSEWHLLRYLGYHRDYLTQEVLKEIHGDSIHWLDFKFSKVNRHLELDKELIGLEFIKDKKILDKWRDFWPQTGNPPNWDAVSQISFGNKGEWLLVEAKSHIGEIRSRCGASENSRKKIRSALEKTSVTFGNHSQPVENWLGRHYQFANRLAVLHFLLKECSPPLPARLLFIFFCGDKIKNRECPKSQQKWQEPIQGMEDSLGIDRDCELYKRVHYLFLPVILDSQVDRPIT